MRKHFPDFFLENPRSDYVIYEAHTITLQSANIVRESARNAYRIFEKIVEYLCSCTDEMLIAIGIPEQLAHVVKIGYQAIPDCLVGRFDFILTDTGPKLIEFNAHTPYFIYESHYMNGILAKEFGLSDPNKGAQSLLAETIIGALRQCARGGRSVVVGHIALEDAMTARYVLKILQEKADFEIEYSPVHQLTIQEDGLYDMKAKIDVMFSLYPLELFALDSGGVQLFRLLLEDKVRLLNPPASLLLQNKATLALIWELYEKTPFFTAEEQEIVARIFLPTYGVVPDDAFDYVSKPILGREGNSVKILRRDGSLQEGRGKDYIDQPRVFQKYVQAPLTTYLHPFQGAMQGYPITTCFIVGGVPTALGMRIGKEISDVDAHFFPLGYAHV